MGGLDTGFTPHTLTPGFRTFASTILFLAHLPWNPYPPSDENGVPAAPSLTLSHTSPWVFPLVTIQSQDGLQNESCRGHPHTQRQAQQVFQVCPSDTTAEKEIPGCNDCLQPRYLIWVVPQHIQWDPHFFILLLWEQIQTTSVWTVHTALGAPCPTLGEQIGG